MARIKTYADVVKLWAAGAPSAAEEKLIDCCRAGEPCVLGHGNRPDNATADNTVSSDLLRYLILGGCDGCKVDDVGVSLRGGWIKGTLDLSFASAKGQTALTNCHFTDKVEALQARFWRLDLSGSKLPGLLGQGAEVAGDVFLQTGFHATHTVDLAGAKIGGQLCCRCGAFEGRETPKNDGSKTRGHALNVQGAEVAAGVFLNGTFSAIGEVSLSGAKIGGQLECSGGTFMGRATIGANRSKTTGYALNAHSAKIKGEVFLVSGFSSYGGVILTEAKIGGQLECSGGRFKGGEITSCKGSKSRSPALNLQGAEVAGGVNLRNSFRAKGEVSLSRARIGGQLECSGGRFEGGVTIGANRSKTRGHALNAQRAEVTGSVFFVKNFRSCGEVRLAGAKIGGQLECSGGQFEGGEITADNGKKTRGHALVARDMKAGSLLWCKVKVNTGLVDLTSAHCTNLHDDLESWPQDGNLVLDGFTYDRITGEGTFTDAARRLEWLQRGSTWDGAFFPQPYEQLAKVLGAMGHTEDRRKVLIEKERLVALDRQRRAKREIAALTIQIDAADSPTKRQTLVANRSWLWLDSKLAAGWSACVRRGVAYGYAPQRAAGWGSLLVLVGYILALITWHSGQFAPNSDVIVDSVEWQLVARDPTIANPAAVWSQKADAAKGDKQGQGLDYESFNALAYSFDLVVPLITLGQEAAWAPSKDRGFWGKTLWWMRWPLAVLGWIITALGAAAVTGIIRRE